MLEYNGYKIYEIDFGEKDYIVAKNICSAIRHWLDTIGDDCIKNEITIRLREKDFLVKTQSDKIKMASEILEQNVKNAQMAEEELPPCYIATTCLY